MKDQAIPLLLSIVTTLLNYIFITSITGKQKQGTITDFKDALKMLRADVLTEVKENKLDLLNQIKEGEQNVISQVKELGQQQQKQQGGKD